MSLTRKYKESKSRESGAMNESHSADKTKVVIRHLPPALSQSTLMEKIDSVFAGRYDWVLFRSGKSGPKNQSYSRAYVNFKRPHDVIEFASFFNGHVFVNEKGTQFKAIVEYAPSQHVPKECYKKDSRDGTIYKDPDYLEFLEFISKPVENLPSAEVQLERREAEKSGGQKDSPIVTPLMDFVRQKRAARSESRRILSNGKINRRAGTSGSPSSSSSSKRGSEKKRNSTAHYVMRDTVKGAKDKPSNVVIAKRDDKKLVENAFPEMSDSGKKKILLVKGKEKEILTNQRQEPTGRIVKSILINSDRISSDQTTQHVVLEKEKRPPRPPVSSKDINGITGNDLSLQNDKEKRIRNRDRSDRVIWTPLRRSDGSFSSEESQSSLQPFSETTHAEAKGDVRIITGGRVSQALFDNGTAKQFSRRGPPHAIKDSESQMSEVKGLKRGGNPSFESSC